MRLAHFSVKEYLESERILRGQACTYHMQEDTEHRFIAQSCLIYLLHYSESNAKTSSKQDLSTFTLLEYAATSWFSHSSLQGLDQVGHELRFLCSDESKNDWLSVHQPDQGWCEPLENDMEIVHEIGSALYYASFVGLKAVIKQLLTAGADVNEQGGWYGNSLQAGSIAGSEKVVQMLMDAGADVNAQGGHCGNALQAALVEGREKVALMLMDAGADMNAQEGAVG